MQRIDLNVLPPRRIAPTRPQRSGALPARANPLDAAGEH